VCFACVFCVSLISSLVCLFALGNVCVFVVDCCCGWLVGWLVGWCVGWLVVFGCFLRACNYCRGYYRLICLLACLCVFVVACLDFTDIVFLTFPCNANRCLTCSLVVFFVFACWFCFLCFYLLACFVACARARGVCEFALLVRARERVRLLTGMRNVC